MILCSLIVRKKDSLPGFFQSPPADPGKLIRSGIVGNLGKQIQRFRIVVYAKTGLNGARIRLDQGFYALYDRFVRFVYCFFLFFGLQVIAEFYLCHSRFGNLLL